MASDRILTLASRSPRRASLLTEWNIRFRIRPTEVEEHDAASLPHANPKEMVLANARLKALAAARRFPSAWVLSADTLVALGQKIFGKPRDMADAQAMLSRLVGQTHEVHTAVCLYKGKRRQCSFITTSRVTFKPLTAAQIRRYLQKIDPLDKAGSYAAQEHTNLIIQNVEGSFSNVVGLPMERLARELSKLGWELPPRCSTR